MQPRAQIETLQGTAGTIERKIQAMLYGAQTGAAPPAPAVEYVLVCAVEQGDEVVGGLIDAEELIARGLCEHVIDAAAEDVAVALYGGTQARLERRDAVPGFVECGAFDSHGKLRIARKKTDECSTGEGRKLNRMAIFSPASTLIETG